MDPGVTLSPYSSECVEGEFYELRLLGSRMFRITPVQHP
jgi:hypothetical protein